ncbi:deaminase [Flavobacterium psychrotrophum]|uniref:deaminase n=1 Tax=Flavobacterium psychrotrophum TaxID=2294119 RepID=UPI000E31EE78|nr:deaminase [Flavobacterium psychrotrophum]
MAKKQSSESTPQEYMELAIAVMNKSIQEPRSDKVSPKVGAVLIKTDGMVETASRGELRHGDHAEFTLLERKNRSTNLDGAILYATLEPCAPGARKHPKLCCAERIVNARIKKVYVGIEDPDPTVDRKGIKYLQDHGVEVEMFDLAFQEQIRQENKQFITEAEERAKKVKEPYQPVLLSEKERAEVNADLDDLNENEINNFINQARIDVQYGTPSFFKVFQQLGLVDQHDGTYIPTGLGILLFGKHPQLLYQNATIRATYKTTGGKEQIENFNGPLVSQTSQAMEWFERVIGHQVNRNNAQRQMVLDYPGIVIREALSNAVVHRDYDLAGAPIFFEISDDAITIKSPGEPVPL